MNDDMSCDALMRWEWEGGAPPSVNERAEAAGAEPATTGRTRPQLKRRQRARCAPTSSLRPTERRQGDGRER
jgi:hypothetical protein